MCYRAAFYVDQVPFPEGFALVGKFRGWDFEKAPTDKAIVYADLQFRKAIDKKMRDGKCASYIDAFRLVRDSEPGLNWIFLDAGDRVVRTS